ncbi:MAG: 3-isopropylmalate dehydratase large subunit [Alphaproteobacteria bacterium]|nr:3-isopropylmalate dehydratase large subunit [Alphaproteobacteria bacterium]
MSNQGPKTLFDKIWSDHLVGQREDGTSLLYIDRHLVHEVTSPQAFEGLKLSNRKVRRPESTFATADHNVPTINRENIADEQSRIQVETLAKNTKEHNIEYFELTDRRQGIVHIIGPEQGITQPGMTMVCGDSHTSTHGAFGALAFGIGTSEVEHVLATQTIVQKPAKNMRIAVNGKLPFGVTSKDLILYIIGQIGTAGGNGHVIEYAGTTLKPLSMESRMTICNMSIEAGARAGLIAPDQITFDYIKGRPYAPSNEHWEKAIEYWSSLPSDQDAFYDKELIINSDEIDPMVTWGTSPEDVVAVNGFVPDPSSGNTENKQKSIQRSLDYMGLKSGTKITDIRLDKIFIGSCTNGRIEDLRNVASIVKDKKIASHIGGMIVPGSGLVKKQAEEEGLSKIFIDAGFEWRDAGCSMCLGMNPDQLKPGERCASTSNRNFEGRQGRGGRTHLMSPELAAASAIVGNISDIRDFS